jgi:hypothetical protein
MEKKDRYEALKLDNAAIADKVKALQSSDNIDRDESSGLGSSTTSRHRVADGKRQITDADGRAYRVYNKIKGAEAIRANLHTVRLTDPFRLDVLLGEERIQLVPSVWLSILEKKCTDDFLGFTFGDRTGWATAALYCAVKNLPVMQLDGLTAFLDGSCNSTLWFRPKGSKRVETLEEIADAFRAIEWVYVVCHSGAFSGICAQVTSQLYSKPLQFAHRDYLVHYLERCLQEFNRITSSPIYEPAHSSWPRDLRSVAACVKIWHILFSDIASSMTLVHQNVYQEAISRNEMKRFTMANDVLVHGNPFLASKNVQAKRDREDEVISADDLVSVREVKRLQSELTQVQGALALRDSVSPVADTDYTQSAKQSRYCGEHILSLTYLGDPCIRGESCRFVHPTCIEECEITKVIETFESFWGTRVDPDVLDSAYALIVASTSENADLDQEEELSNEDEVSYEEDESD